MDDQASLLVCDPFEDDLGFHVRGIGCEDGGLRTDFLQLCKDLSFNSHILCGCFDHKIGAFELGIIRRPGQVGEHGIHFVFCEGTRPHTATEFSFDACFPRFEGFFGNIDDHNRNTELMKHLTEIEGDIRPDISRAHDSDFMDRSSLKFPCHN